jgi:hypothetical protein
LDAKAGARQRAEPILDATIVEAPGGTAPIDWRLANRIEWGPGGADNQRERVEDRLADVLQEHRAELGDGDTAGAGGGGDRLRSGHLSGVSFGCDSRGQVHGCPEHVTIALHRVAMVKPCPQRRKLGLGSCLREQPLHERDARCRIARRHEHGIADGLDEPIAWRERRARELGEQGGHIGRILVALGFGQGRETRQVDEAKSRLYAARQGRRRSCDHLGPWLDDSALSRRGAKHRRAKCGL